MYWKNHHMVRNSKGSVAYLDAKRIFGINSILLSNRILEALHENLAKCIEEPMHCTETKLWSNIKICTNQRSLLLSFLCKRIPVKERGHI